MPSRIVTPSSLLMPTATTSLTLATQKPFGTLSTLLLNGQQQNPAYFLRVIAIDFATWARYATGNN